MSVVGCFVARLSRVPTVVSGSAYNKDILSLAEWMHLPDYIMTYEHAWCPSFEN